MKNLESIVFFGTHELAVPVLETLAGLELMPRLVVTRPQAGLARDPVDPPPHPVRVWARERKVKVVSSRRAAEPDLREKIAGLEPDLLVVADYGRPLPGELLGAAAWGAVEVHPSLLPKLRGEHALRAALAAGYKKTGVTVIRVAEEPWGGDVLLQEELEISEHESFGKILPRARELSSQLLTQVLRKLDRGKGKMRGKSQNEQNATEAPRIGGRHRRAPWSLEAPQVYNRLRAYSPPGLNTYHKYRPVEVLSGMPMDWVQAPYGSTGTYLGMRQGKLAVLCGGSTVFGIERLRRPQGENQDAQDASGFARAEELRVGDQFV